MVTATASWSVVHTLPLIELVTPLAPGAGRVMDQRVCLPLQRLIHSGFQVSRVHGEGIAAAVLLRVLRRREPSSQFCSRPGWARCTVVCFASWMAAGCGDRE